MKLFAVCRHRGIPVLTVVNKWDRPGKDALELMDEISERTGLTPTPLTWPVGIAGDFRGVLDRSDGTYRRFTRTAGGATIAPEETLSAKDALAREGDAWQQAVEEVELLGATGADHEQSLFLDGVTTPVLFASAVSNFGVGALLDTLVGLAPPPAGQPDVDGTPRPLTDPFSAFVFKVQAGMDSAHRDRLAFIRICSGVFERGMVVTHARTRPTFAPEHFAVCRGRDTAKHKQFRRGIEQLDSEGVVQVLRSDRRGEQAPVLAVVGPMQFEVAQHRMEHEFGAPIDLDRLPYSLALRTDESSVPGISAARGAEVLQRTNGELLAVFTDKWGLRVLQQNKPELRLEPLVAAQLG
jgi:peptide chain release factor 3